MRDLCTNAFFKNLKQATFLSLRIFLRKNIIESLLFIACLLLPFFLVRCIKILLHQKKEQSQALFKGLKCTKLNEQTIFTSKPYSTYATCLAIILAKMPFWAFKVLGVPLSATLPSAKTTILSAFATVRIR